jgi:hypothetical protein
MRDRTTTENTIEQMRWRNLAAIAAIGLGVGLASTSPALAKHAHPPPAPLPAPHKPPQPTVVTELQRLNATGAITAASAGTYLAQWRGVLNAEQHLHGWRAAELTDVTETVHQIAADGGLTPSRLPAIFLTLERNSQWWTHGYRPSYGQRIQFPGSGLVWEYYPGQGIQLQVLASFARANALYAAGRADYPALQSLLGELIPLAVNRAGGLTWEYYFNFDGGRPPWISAMAQATALEALANGYAATADPTYLQVAAQALAPLTTRPPAGVGTPTPLGRRFLQYSFAPKTDIINAFLQTLIGLDRYAQVSGSAAAQTLFNEGNAQAEAELPMFNTGAWSLYQLGIEDTLSYHELVTGFLTQLCSLTAGPVYCTTANAFRVDLTTPPTLAQLTVSARAGRPFALRFRLSKEARVGVSVTQGAKQVLATSKLFPYGVGAFSIPALKTAGNYTVRLAATDLAGNFARVVGALTVAPGPRQPAGPGTTHPPSSGGVTLARTG